MPRRRAQTATSTLSWLQVGAYGSALLALLYAGVSAYWTVGGTALLSTVGGPLEELARHPTATAVALGAAVTAAKLAGAGLSLALVQAWGRRLPQRLLSWAATAAAAVLTIYGGLLVVVGALALLGLFGPPPGDATALRWHVMLWDLWFLLWGLLLGTAAWQRRRRPQCRAHSSSGSRRVSGNRHADVRGGGERAPVTPVRRTPGP